MIPQSKASVLPVMVMMFVLVMPNTIRARSEDRLTPCILGGYE